MPDLARGADASMQVATTWAVEFGELDKVLRADANTVKDYVSRSVDTYRRPYGRDVLSKPRQCVFIGTTNEDDFLRDATGERRFWPLHVRKRLNLPEVRAMRDSVWAAAYVLAMREDFEHWIEPHSLLDAQLRARHGAHVLEDAWHETVWDYCAGRDFVTGKDVYRVAIMKCDPDWLRTWNRASQVRIADTLRRIGADKHVKRDPATGALVKGYALPASVRDCPPSPAEVARRRANEGGTVRLAPPG